MECVTGLVLLQFLHIRSSGNCHRVELHIVFHACHICCRIQRQPHLFPCQCQMDILCGFACNGNHLWTDILSPRQIHRFCRLSGTAYFSGNRIFDPPATCRQFRIFRRLLQRVLNAFFRNGNWIADIAVRCIDCFFNQLYIFLENRQLFGLCGSFHIPLRNSIVVVFAAKGFGI